MIFPQVLRLLKGMSKNSYDEFHMGELFDSKFLKKNSSHNVLFPTGNPSQTERVGCVTAALQIYLVRFCIPSYLLKFSHYAPSD